MHGGDLVAEVLERQGVQSLFTLCGGHISPILTGAKARGIRVIDTRHEADAVFAADAVARMTGTPGVAAVTAGPGVTNTITAIKNAQLAQSPVVVIGGATAVLLRGRGALQDIDQMALVSPHVKLATRTTKVKELVPALEHAFEVAQSGVPGPVFVECPVDLLYDEKIVREMMGAKAAGDVKSLPDVALQLYLRWYLSRLFAGSRHTAAGTRKLPEVPAAFPGEIERAARMIRAAQHPVMLIGSQATLGGPDACARLVGAIEQLGIPVFLSGMARGLLGRAHPLLHRHKRGNALKEADLVVLAGVPCDFRLNYGLHIGKKAQIVAVNRSDEEVAKNRKPTLAVVADPCAFVCSVAREAAGSRESGGPWPDRLRTRDRDREQEISEQAAAPGELVHPLALCRGIEDALDPDSVVVADGGDFVATASYVVSPRGPLRWLDPGVFGTLGVGAGFALGAKVCRPQSEVWILYGDGSVGYSLAEIDTFVRHGMGVIAIVGNDASWAQIARDQVTLLGDDVGTVLRRTDYHKAAEGLGGVGLLLERNEDIERVLAQAKALAREGKPVLVNAHLRATEFRKGSISM